MLSERLISLAVRETSKNYLKINRTTDTHVPGPKPGQKYMLYMHVPFCTKLCPYCSFNRFPFSEKRAVPYFESMRKEMRMLADLGYDFDSVYIGGGTPTVMIDELCATIDQARDLFSVKEVSSETNPNHLVPEILEKLEGRVQRLSVGVQSFDDGLLKQMDRYDKYGCADEIVERIQLATPYFTSMNADMIFNFPAQTEDMLIHDVERIVESGCTQTTFYPLMASPSVERSLARTVGKVDYNREQRYYEIIDELLAGGDKPLFTHSSAWTYNRFDYNSGADANENGMIDEPSPHSVGAHPVRPVKQDGAEAKSGSGMIDESSPRPVGAHPVRPVNQDGAEAKSGSGMIDEYVVQYEEYPAIGSGGITYLGSSLYVNTFSLREYGEAIEAGRMSLMGRTDFNIHDRMRYRFLMQLFGLRLDKLQWERDFGMTVENGLPAEMAFMKLAGAFATDTPEELTLTPKGRYLVVAMMRQFFIGVNNLRDQARAALPGEERELLFG